MIQNYPTGMGEIEIYPNTVRLSKRDSKKSVLFKSHSIEARFLSFKVKMARFMEW